VSRGESFEAIVPILWLMAGSAGELALSRGGNHWFMPKESPYAVLLKEDHLRDFKRALTARSDVTHVFIVTDSTEAFREMADDLGHGREYFQLYKSYLENFRINLERIL
jgi:adenine-specific DNA-methyltransferase